MDYAIVAQGNLDLMREIQGYLERRGVRSHMTSPPGGCGST
jgi:hypothetical protein